MFLAPIARMFFNHQSKRCAFVSRYSLIVIGVLATLASLPGERGLHRTRVIPYSVSCLRSWGISCNRWVISRLCLHVFYLLRVVHQTVFSHRVLLSSDQGLPSRNLDCSSVRAKPGIIHIVEATVALGDVKWGVKQQSRLFVKIYSIVFIDFKAAWQRSFTAVQSMPFALIFMVMS